MRISEKKYPALKYLKTGFLDINISNQGHKEFLKEIANKPEEARDLYLFDFDRNKNDFCSNINIVKESFWGAMIKARKSLIEIWKKELLDENEKTYKNSGVYIISNVTLFFKMEKIISGSFFPNISFYMFIDDTLIGCIIINNMKYFCFTDKKYLLDSKLIKDTVKDDTSEYILKLFFVSNIILPEIFKRYAKVETVEMSKSKRRITDEKGEKYFNETDYDVTVLDSKWFKEIVKDEDFAVKGHFRLQPKKKDGKWTKELIWIENFIKHGYHRKAKVDIYNNQY